MLETQDIRPSDEFSALQSIENLEQEILRQELAEHPDRGRQSLDSQPPESDETLPPYRGMLLKVGWLTWEEEEDSKDMRSPQVIMAEASADRLADRYAWAAMKYARVIQRVPDWADAHFLLGAVFLDQGFSKDALVCFQYASRLAPDNGTYVSAIGKLQSFIEPREARQTLLRAIDLDPTSPDAWGFLAREHSRLGCFKDAFEAFSIALRLDKDYFERHPEHQRDYQESVDVVTETS
jgi:tetratricopeptide (TPR) repeat protein